MNARPSPWTPIALLVGLLACGCQTDDGALPEVTCGYEVQISSSCSDAEADWTPLCVALPDADTCAAWTTPVQVSSAGCGYRRDYREVAVGTPDAPLPTCQVTSLSVGAPEAADRERAAGQPCLEGDWCASGVCAFGQYCTMACASLADCGAAFAEGCCVGAVAGDGLCMQAVECRAVCGANAHPEGLPTRCVCDEGYVVSADGTRCQLDSRRGLGEACLSASECASEVCLGEAAAGRLWCSQRCTTDSDCQGLLGAADVTRACCATTAAGLACVVDEYCP